MKQEESKDRSTPAMSLHSPAVNPRYAVLFDPVRIGPVTAPESFLSGPPRKWHDERLAACARALSRDEGGRRLGCGMHRRRVDSPEL